MSNGISGPFEYDPKLFKKSGFESNPQGISRNRQPTPESLPTVTDEATLGKLVVTVEKTDVQPEAEIGGEG